ncbi:MAG: hypothetical protein U9Q66_01775 [Patescibacteria group bacterium]|nr:hypothetical protein [Patescibacteria group bacterium]
MFNKDFQISNLVTFNSSSINLFSSSSLAFCSFVSRISDFISFLNSVKSIFLPLNCSINSGVNSGLIDFSIELIFISNLISLFANSAL